jgi:hypothetical protein
VKWVEWFSLAELDLIMRPQSRDRLLDYSSSLPKLAHELSLLG